MVIGFCYNIKKNLPSTNPHAQIDAEFDAPSTILAIRKALESGGHTVIEIEADAQAFQKLQHSKNKIDIVFNIAEGFYGEARESYIPILCDMLQIPYTHSSPITHAISLNKTITKKILIYHGIPTPAFQLFLHPEEKLDPKLQFPILLKPNAEGSSKGILNENLVKNTAEFTNRLKWLFKNFKQAVLAEEFLDGREFTVALLGNPPQVLPIIEQNLGVIPKKYAQFASYEVKWLWEDTLKDTSIACTCPAKIPNALRQKIEKICLATWNGLNVSDVARIDVRLTKNGEPNILEINTLPGMMPADNVVSYLPMAARAVGLEFNAMILAILAAACKRYRLN